jgi:hypothetical protein
MTAMLTPNIPAIPAKIPANSHLVRFIANSLIRNFKVFADALKCAPPPVAALPIRAGLSFRPFCHSYNPPPRRRP